MSAISGKQFRFGPFEADLPAGELRKNGRLIRLQVQPFLVLAALLERPGEVVTRDELRERLWPRDSFGEFDQGLNTAINKLREALGDSAASPKFVETLPKRGYRFTHPVEAGGTPGESEAASPSMPARTRKYVLGAVAIALSTACLAVVLARPEAADPQLPLRRFVIRPPISVYDCPSWGSAVAVSPDGKHIAFVEQQPGGRLWIQDLDRQSPRVIEGTEGAWRPFWSPDSTMIGFAVSGELRKVSVRGGSSIPICRECARSFFGATWSPDGRSIVFGEGAPSSLYEIQAAGGQPRLLRSWEQVRRPDGSGGSTPGHLFSPYFLPSEAGGRVIVFSFGHPASLVVWNLDTARDVVLGTGIGAVYSRTGHLLYQSRTATADIWALPFSLKTLGPTGEAFRVAGSAIDATVAADGTLVYLDAGSEHLVWRDRRGTQATSIGPPVDGVFYPALSPDGRSVAVETLENGNLDVWVYDLERGARTRLTAHTATDIVPVWSPKGDAVAFSSYRSGNIDVFVRQADASAEMKTIAATPHNERVSDWSHDGRYILYSVLDPKNGYDIWYVERNQQGHWEPHPYLHSSSNEKSAKLSPDARYIAYMSDETGRDEVYVRPFPVGNRKWSISAKGGRQIRWRRDGREIFYLEEDTLMAVPVRNTREFEPGPARPLFSNVGLDVWPEANYDVSPDGERFLLPQRVSSQERNIHVVQNWFAEFRR